MIAFLLTRLFLVLLLTFLAAPGAFLVGFVLYFSNPDIGIFVGIFLFVGQFTDFWNKALR